MKIAIVIPCYNEEASIEAVIAGLKTLTVHLDLSITAIVVNDCSTDRTFQIAKELDCICLDLTVNLGIGGAVQTGFKYALHNDFDIAIQFDGDGQHPPEQVPQLLAPILRGECNVVIGSRFIEKEGFQSTFLRRSGIRYFKWLHRTLTGLQVTDSTSGFRAVDKKTLEIVCDYYPDEYPESEALVLYALNSLSIKEIPVVMQERKGGVSSIRSYKSIYYMIKVTLAMLFIYLRLKFDGKRSTL
jgi:glycosyltransferase involved in cell wall biosynthesis